MAVVTRFMCLGAFVTSMFFSISASAETDVEEAKRLYRDHCRVCHETGSEHGKYTPVSYIQIQWERFFDKKYKRKHKKVLDEHHGGQPVMDVIDSETLEKIRKFTIDHAADTDQPMTCG